jgi:HEAT repeat protein
VALAVADDEDPWVRAEAVVALDRLDRERYEERLADAIGDDHHAVRRNAAISLFKQRGEASADVLLALADDPSERVREWAAHLLAGVDDDRAEAALRDLAGDDTESEVVRSTAARSLEADAGRFRRQFTGALDDRETTLPGEDRLNRNPEL